MVSVDMEMEGGFARAEGKGTCPMFKRNAVFLITNFPYTLDIRDEQAWRFVQKEIDRDFPWLLKSRYSVTFSGVGKGWRGCSRRAGVASHSSLVGTGWMPLDAVLAWVTHFVDTLRAWRRGHVVALAPTPEAGLGVALARLLLGERVRLVVRVQGHTASKALLVRRSRLRFIVLERIESFVVRRADLVIPMGKFTYELSIYKGADPEKIIVLPFPVRWAASGSVSPLPGQPCVLFVGRLEKEKGVHVLLQAMRKIQESIMSVRLLIAGDGSYRPELERMVDYLGLRGRVLFLGRLDADRLQDAYREAWVLVLPSIWAEGLGMVLVEAGLMGRPAIGSDLGGIRDIIQHGYNGFLVPPGDATALAEAITTVLKDRDLAHRMGMANLEAARRYLSGREEVIDRVHKAIRAFLETQ